MSKDSAKSETSQKELSPWQGLLRMGLEVGPLIVFFVVNNMFDLMVGTAAFMVAMVISCGGSWLLEKRLPLMPLVTTIFVLVFGGLTLILDDGLFIKIKPTIVNLLFASTLLAGMLFNQPILKHLFGHAFALSSEGWRILTMRWTCFFIFLAVVNEVVWRNFSTEFWLGFKLYGIFPLSIIFALWQMQIVLRYPEDKESSKVSEKILPEDQKSK